MELEDILNEDVDLETLKQMRDNWLVSWLQTTDFLSFLDYVKIPDPPH